MKKVLPDTVGAQVKWARNVLRGSESAALDARLLLCHVTGFSAADVIAEPERLLTPDQLARYATLVRRRLSHEPVSKILGAREFYGRSFQVTRDVLDPRPDTEALIALCLRLAVKERPIHLLDLGSGSGAICVTLLAELPMAQCVAVDVSEEALRITTANSRLHNVSGRLKALKSSWFERVTSRCDLIISNPPYIARSELAALAPDVIQFDPVLALDGGEDGLACYRLIAAKAEHFLLPDGQVIVEIGVNQERDVDRIFSGQGFEQTDRERDLAGRVRALAFKF